MPFRSNLEITGHSLPSQALDQPGTIWIRILETILIVLRYLANMQLGWAPGLGQKGALQPKRNGHV